MNPVHFFEERGVPFSITQGEEAGWRVRSKLAVRAEAGEVKIGLFKPGTHQVQEDPDCKEHHPKINEAVKLVKRWMEEEGVAAYDEAEHRGLVRYLQCVVERKSGRVQLALAVTSKRGIEEKIGRLLKLAPRQFWHSIWLNRHPHPSNVIFSSEWEKLYGEEWLWEEILDTPFCFHPGSFGQANLALFEKLIERLSTFVPQGTALLELYAGIGAISLALAKRAQTIDLVESNPLSKLCFDAQQALFPEPKAHYHSLLSADSAPLIARANTVIVDPPRKGLDEATLTLLLASRPSRLIYVSCGFPSFVRDLAILQESGFTLSHAEGFLFFPGTEHIEILAVLDDIEAIPK